MKIKQKNTRKKTVLLITVVVIAILSASFLIYHAKNSQNNLPSSDSGRKSMSKKSANDDTNTNEAKQNNSTNTDNSDTDTASPQTDPQASESFSTITEPNTQPIDITADLPVENAKYRISKGDSPNSFNVTLYAIEGADYTSQLQRYKREALNYLISRSGSSNIKVNWTPQEAEGL